MMLELENSEQSICPNLFFTSSHCPHSSLQVKSHMSLASHCPPTSLQVKSHVSLASRN